MILIFHCYRDSTYWIEVKKWLEECNSSNDNYKEVILYSVNVDKDTTLSEIVGVSIH